MSTVFVSWFPNNLARNSLACLSNIEIRSLELQRLWRLLNCQANELRAKFPGRGWGEAVAGFPVAASLCVGGAAVSTVVVLWFPNNLARNSLACLSNIEIGSLELQRLWLLLKYQANELRAKFPGRGWGEAVAGYPVAASVCVGAVARRCVVVSQQSRMQFPVIVSGKMRSGSRFPNNLARNSLACLSNIEIGSLELQRLWRLLNCQASELRAKFLTRGLGGAGSGPPRRSGRDCTTGR